MNAKATAQAHPAVAPIPLGRLIGVELRKMFDTRSGLWLMMSIAVLSVVATVAVIVFAPDEDVHYLTFASALGFPMSVILPVIAILGVTSEWSQRSGLTTFTLVPSRAKVIGAKAVATAVVGVISMILAGIFGAVGNLAGSTIVGTDTVWNISLGVAVQIILGNLVGMAVGFTLGVVFRNSPAAIVGYFVLAFLIPGVLVLLAQVRDWFAELQPWIDWTVTQEVLFMGKTSTAQEWTHLASTTAIWIILPLALGLALLRRSEVK